ncbi:hypothetical protein [Novosphingobium panipatense]|uniref:DUF429 domain-containing protein n=1 Tax=Novosphingobium panipatense TaxID=428991 RepID=A0ABY1Q757_9SPHN|nr:hypothetical protein [Novosphingobium panipatense]SMP61828.1 hypothetical protein SAMN06296065_103324 [Novosphingobium panipatense]
MTEPRFRHFLAVDWSGAVGERQKGIAVALCASGDEAPCLLRPPSHDVWSRQDVLDFLLHRLPAETLVGLDLGLSLPFRDGGAFFPGWSDSPADAPALWALVDAICADDPHLSASSFVDHEAASAYFRRHGGREGALFHLPGADHRRGRMRVTEEAQARAGCRPYSNFNLVGAAQVGKSSLTGMRLLHRLRGRLPVWPVDPVPDTGSVVTEIYTSLAALEAGRSVGRAKMTDYCEVNAALQRLGSKRADGTGRIDDHSADAIVTAAWLRVAAHRPHLWRPAELDRELAITEGWTFGAA